MPEIVTCPQCSRKLRVPDELLGKKVKCPDCKSAFTATAGDAGDEGNGEETPKAPSNRNESVSTSASSRSSSDKLSSRKRQQEEDDGPPRRSRDEEDEDHPPRPEYEDDDDDDEGRGGRRGAGGGTRLGWRRVRLGLNLMIWGIYTQLAGVALFILLIILALILFLAAGAGAASVFTAPGSGSGSGGAGGAAVGGAAIVGLIAIFVGYGTLILTALVKLGLDVAGHIFYLFIPNKPGTGRKPLAIATLSLFAAHLLLPFLSFFLACMGGMISGGSGGRGGGAGVGQMFGMMGQCLNLIGLVCQIAWFFVFMFFLRSVAAGMGNYGLTKSIIAHMIAWPVYIVVAIFSWIITVCVGGVAAAGIAGSSQNPNAGTAGAAFGGWMIFMIIVGGLILLCGLALWIWYIVILHQTRGSIDRKVH